MATSRARTSQQSAEAVVAEDPDFVVSGVNDDHGTHMVTNDETGQTVTVDGRTGEVLGSYETEGHPPGCDRRGRSRSPTTCTCAA